MKEVLIKGPSSFSSIMDNLFAYHLHYPVLQPGSFCLCDGHWVSIHLSFKT